MNKMRNVRTLRRSQSEGINYRVFEARISNGNEISTVLFIAELKEPNDKDLEPRTCFKAPTSAAVGGICSPGAVRSKAVPYQAN